MSGKRPAKVKLKERRGSFSYLSIDSSHISSEGSFLTEEVVPPPIFFFKSFFLKFLSNIFFRKESKSQLAFARRFLLLGRLGPPRVAPLGILLFRSWS